MAAILVACGPAVAPASAPVGAASVPRLKPPKAIDPSVYGAAYLTQVALQLQPGWGQFLDDCRIRLPASHPLNVMTLAAKAEVVVARDGRVEAVNLTSSGNADFDRAVRDAIADAAPLPAPPAELLSDDDRAHLRWLFARDRRQAGPATAEVRQVDLPLREVVAREIAGGELARAARRIARAPVGVDRDDTTRELMIAVLRNVLVRGDREAKTVAIEAVRGAHVTPLVADVRALLGPATELGVRLSAIATAAELFDREAATPLLAQLADDVRTEPRVALAEARALAAFGREDAAAAAVRAVLDDPRALADARATALETAAALPALATELAPRFGRGDARMRAAACKAAAGATLDAAASWLAAGLRDPDASVRAAGTDAARSQAAAHRDDRRVTALVGRFRELARDRDTSVRARAIAALALDPEQLPRVAADPAAAV
ncbi:MAG: TonB family protein, partial [Acidobacteriota bacterium]